MPAKEDLKRWKEHEKQMSRAAVALFGFDTTKLNWRDQQAAEEAALRRIQLEEELRRRNPQPEQKLSETERLKKRRIDLLEAKFRRIANGRPVKELSNDDLKDQAKILREIV